MSQNSCGKAADRGAQKPRGSCLWERALAAPAAGEQPASVALASAAGRFQSLLLPPLTGALGFEGSAFGQAPGGVLVLPHTEQLSGAAALL